MALLYMQSNAFNCSSDSGSTVLGDLYLSLYPYLLGMKQGVP